MNPESHQCPKCNGTNFKDWRLPHPIILHWVLNPGLAFNELILGQRLPKSQLICKDCKNPLMERVYVPCPTCKTMHSARHGSGKSAFGNWRGLSCPSCMQSIPCLWNLFSIIILAVTFPLWSIPYFLYFKNKPLSPLYHIEENEPPKPKPITLKTWIIMGASWGAFMWLFITLYSSLVKGHELSWDRALLNLPIWAIAGFLFGFSMWFFLGRSKQRENNNELE